MCCAEAYSPTSPSYSPTSPGNWFCLTSMSALLAASVTVMPVSLIDHVTHQARISHTCMQTACGCMTMESHIIMQLHDHPLTDSLLVIVAFSCLPI